ncbi:hypothetical protein E2C01_048467 [Portunus trituberculatus]|uniref:Uncharacterized protein n=1 Tax=Portunus trituberculatus TaxID=210409 RepID=A0A5B7GAM6_PORTR|nr:hypothetical protein [Portunus trituberculatus]
MPIGAQPRYRDPSSSIYAMLRLLRHLDSLHLPPMWLSRLRVALRYSSVDLEYKLHYICESSYTGHHQFRVQPHHTEPLAASFLSCVDRDSHQAACRAVSPGKEGVHAEAVRAQGAQGKAIEVTEGSPSRRRGGGSGGSAAGLSSGRLRRGQCSPLTTEDHKFVYRFYFFSVQQDGNFSVHVLLTGACVTPEGVLLVGRGSLPAAGEERFSLIIFADHLTAAVVKTQT